ncbi:Hypothetical predicted protein [Pelobates cultripes]|uniref:Uncharacterized protein n=1 Tax=Pelobates cultripes TaxID=61616 RepID=A0AAD1W5K5_PELCU|nr:Hypothetical predicted protein [Pelobates cultripes]
MLPDVLRNIKGIFPHSADHMISLLTDNWYNDEYSHCCISDEDERPTFNHQCNNSTNNCTKLNSYNPELIFQCSNSEFLHYIDRNIPKRADCSRLDCYYFVERFAERFTEYRRSCGEIGPIGMNGKTRVGAGKS